MNLLKEDIRLALIANLQQSISELKTQIALLQLEESENTKSSAGDKYETSREMATQEFNRMQALLIQKENQVVCLHNIKPIPHNVISVGSLFSLDQTWFYMAISYGILTLNNQTIMVVSPTSPVGEMCKGQKLNYCFELNGNNKKITNLS